MANQFDYLSKREIFSPEAEALVDVATGRRYTYRMFNKRANQVTNVLQQELDFKKGDRLCLLAHNSIELWEAFFGSQKCGGIFVALNWRLVIRELTEMIRDINPQVLIYDQSFAAVVSEIERDVAIDHWIALSPEGIGPENSLIYEEVISKSPTDPPKEVDISYDDPMGIVFTGGTTGLPKGAKITYNQVAFNTLNTIRDILPGDIYINHLPLFHVGGVYVYPVPLFILGGKVVQMKSWDAEKLLELIETEKPTFFFCLPTQYRMLMNSPRFETTDFSSIRFLTSGGEPLPLDVIRTFKEKHNVAFKQGFGMTEVGPGCFALDPWDAERKMGSIGTPNFFIDAKVVDPETGEECNPEEVGELLFRGPTVTTGYWNRPKLNKNLLDTEGWFHTGDLVRVDEEGYFYVVDRLKDMYISGGENVYPREIEMVLEQHPKIAQVQLIGIPHPKWGETGRAIVVLKPEEEATEQEILDYCKGKLAKFKIPKTVVFVENFTPYISGAGKILKRALKKDYG